MDAHPQRRWHAAARLGITRELLAHIDALEAALKATYDSYLEGWFDHDDMDTTCSHCRMKYSWMEAVTIHKPDCQGEALKAALGLGKDGER